MRFIERKVEKSDAEKRLDIAMERYLKKFGKPYVFTIGIDSGTMEDTIDRIESLIASGKKQKEPEFEDGVLY